ncbi:MAG: hypothetical protein IJK62_13805 [Bacteroidales bacterium]|nr:hypothetical protein [Bacteroidales bacterium]
MNLDKEIDSKKIYNALDKIVQKYTEPAFGTLSKKELDIVMFNALYELGLIDKKTQDIKRLDVYNVMTKLKVTKTKAKSLIDESSLRKMDNFDFEEQVTKLLEDEMIIVDGNKICLEVENPVLMEYIKSELKKEKHITDGSFSPEIVKLSIPAYLCLCEKFAETHLERLKKKLRDSGVETPLSDGEEKFKDLLAGVVAFAQGDFAGKITDLATKYIQKIRAGKKANQEANKKILTNK